MEFIIVSGGNGFFFQINIVRVELVYIEVLGNL